MTNAPIILAVQEPGVQRSLSVLTEAGMVTVHQTKAISTAVVGLKILEKVSTGVEARPFPKIGAALSVKAPSPASRAREELASIGRVWEGFQEDFHRYRELYFEAKLMRAKLAKAKKALETAGPDDADVLEAEIHLQQARIDKMEAQVVAGQQTMQRTLATVTASSERYALICEKSGKEFTEDDFMLDECDYLIKTAFYHASQTFGWVDISVNRYLDPKDRIRKIRVGQDVLLLFIELGISTDEIKVELRTMMEQTTMMEAIQEGRDVENEKNARFFQWLDRMAAKYHDRSLASMKAGGRDRIDRIAAMVAPADKDLGNRPGKALDRPNMME